MTDSFTYFCGEPDDQVVEWQTLKAVCSKLHLLGLSLINNNVHHIILVKYPGSYDCVLIAD